jgi:hypothetical protein
MPVFTFIKSDVLQDHNLWQRNKSQDFASKIIYPSIDNQSHAVEIFKFIDEIRLAKNNNSYFSFSLPKEIHEQLRKQWAAMFLESLRNRGIAKQMVVTNDALAKLTSVSQKIEELTKSIYKNVDSTNAEASIKTIDQIAEAKSMFHIIAARVGDPKFLSAIPKEHLCNNPPAQWWDFLLSSGYFEFEDILSRSGVERRNVVYLNMNSTALPIELPETKHENSDIDLIASGYQAYLALPPSDREQIYKSFMHRGPVKDIGSFDSSSLGSEFS